MHGDQPVGPFFRYVNTMRNQLDEVGTLKGLAISPMLKVELTCLQALSDLDQMEITRLEATSTGNPKEVALIRQLLLSHRP